MAYRRPSRQKFPQILPVWTSTHTDTVTMAYQALMAKLGITDVRSYIRQLPGFLAMCVVVCACIGAATFNITGFVLGGLAGLVLPAAFLYLLVLLAGAAIFLGIYIAAWAVIWVIAKWVLSEFFRF
jgi:hypothetical protein